MFKSAVKVLVVAAVLLFTPSTAFSQEVSKPAHKDSRPQVVQETKPAGNPPSRDQELPEKLTLQGCLDTAMASRPDLKSIEAQIRQARAVIGEVMAAYYPQVNFTAKLARSGGPDVYSSTVSGTAAGIISSLANSNSDSLVLTQYITDFGRTPWLVTASQESCLSTYFSLVKLRNAIINGVKKAYYNCIAAEELLNAKKENVAVLEEHLKESQAFYDVGKKSKIEVTKSEVNLASARLDMITADNSYKVACVTLINTMGLDRPFRFELARNLELPDFSLSLEEVRTVALVNRPELLKADAGIRSQTASLKAAMAAFYPSITGNAQYSWTNPAYPLDRYWQIGLTMTVPVTDGNQRVNAVREQRAKLESLVADKDRSWQDIVLELEASYLTIKASREKIRVAEKSLQQAEENFRLAQGRYAVGVGSNLEFSDAQVALLSAKTDYISAVVAYFNALSELEKSMGKELKTLEKEKNAGQE